MKTENKKLTVHRMSQQEAGQAIIKSLGVDLNTPGLSIRGLAEEVHVVIEVPDEETEKVVEAVAS